MDGQLKPGAILTSESGNKYTVKSLLGAGGQGEVYDVECGGTHYALKWYFKGSATSRQKKLYHSKGESGQVLPLADGAGGSFSGRGIRLYHAASSEEL